MIFCVYLQAFFTFRMRFVRENFNKNPLFITHLENTKHFFK